MNVLAPVVWGGSQHFSWGTYVSTYGPEAVLRPSHVIVGINEQLKYPAF